LKHDDGHSLPGRELRAVASKGRPGAVEREVGGRQATGRGEVRRARAVVVDHAASARRTRRRVVSGGGEIGRQVTALGRGAARHCVSTAGSAVTVKHVAAVLHGGDSRVGSRMDAEAAAIQEESDGYFFYFEHTRSVRPYGWRC